MLAMPPQSDSIRPVKNILPQVAAPGIRKMFAHLVLWNGNTSKLIGIVSSQ
jgi:hypothetical protein